jgi:hypothetical protein
MDANSAALHLRPLALASKEMTQPVPAYSHEDLQRVVVRDFAPEQVFQAMAILDRYGDESWQREPLRVRMACLKCASGNLDQLAHSVEMAGEDYRGILSEAEYPTYAYAKDESAKEKAISNDWHSCRNG